MCVVCSCGLAVCPTCRGAGVVPAWPVYRPWWQRYPYPVVPVVPYRTPPPFVPGFQGSRGARIDMKIATA